MYARTQQQAEVALMPGYAVKVCTYPGCSALTRDGSGRCDRHPKKAWTRPDAPERMRGRHLQNARCRLFMQNPLCVECERAGRTRLATIRDHRIPLAEGGADDASNEQGLCVACHALKTAQEAQRGMHRK